MIQNPTIIGITGESGVGKSTISEIISLFFGYDNTITISTDDLHKWDRYSKNWEHFTHLNPEANNIELGDLHLQELANGRAIYRSHYNHKTGYFDPPNKIEPNRIIIIEGLHAFYSSFSKDMLDLKIFIDTDETLRTHWKIIRDTEERGYKYNVVLDMINKRKADNEKIRNTQINDADVILMISPYNKIACLGDKNEEIDLDISIKFSSDGPRYSELFNFIKDYIADYNVFIKNSQLIGNDLELCQDAGGNLSIKVSNKHMIIKSSGHCIKDVCKSNGYSLIDYDKLKDNKSNLDNCMVSDKYKKPSMETWFHIYLNKYTIHLHPIYLTLLLCLENSKEIIDKLYNDYNYNYIEYSNPGIDLFEEIQKLPIAEVYFLENHGLIVSSDISSLEIVKNINSKAKEFIQSHTIQFKNFDISFFDNEFTEDFCFPDAVVFSDDKTKKETNAANNYIKLYGNQISNVRYLSSHIINTLNNMSSEKYRKEIK